MEDDHYNDAFIRGILTDHKRFAMVGASPKPERASHVVMKYLLDKGYFVFPVNPGMAGGKILDQTVYQRLSDIGEPVEVVDIFRKSEAALSITGEAIAVGAKVIWMQLGVYNDEAARLARSAGLKVVMNRCPKIEYARLFSLAPGKR
jgi:predicted CoA-binding protein